MKLPLALKVSLWLLLNLAVLAILGLTLLTGPRLRDLVLVGPASGRFDTIARLVGAELSQTEPEGRSAVLTRYSEEYGVAFRLYRPDGFQIEGPELALPEDVVERMPVRRTPRRAGGPLGLRGGPPRPAYDEELAEGSEAEEPASPGAARAGPPPADVERDTPRTLVRAEGDGASAGYWLMQRMPLPRAVGAIAQPAVLALHAPTLWDLRQLLDVIPWLTAGAIVVVVSILFWLPPVFAITRQLRALTAATERIADGDFDTRVDDRRRDELGRLGHAVNLMAARLDAHLRGQKRFLGDIAHELCAPIARLQLAIGILEARAEASGSAAVGDVRTEVEEISALVNELLAFSRASLRRRDQPLVPVELAPLAGRVLAREDTDGRVQLSIPPAITVLGEAALLERALGNLVRIALRYAPAPAAITVSVTSSGENVFLRVEDDGPGVPREALVQLGEPFFRPDTARTRETGGVGLGLAIVRTCVEACRGQVRFANREPRGFRAEIELSACGAE